MLVLWDICYRGMTLVLVSCNTNCLFPWNVVPWESYYRTPITSTEKFLTLKLKQKNPTRYFTEDIINSCLSNQCISLQLTSSTKVSDFRRGPLGEYRKRSDSSTVYQNGSGIIGQLRSSRRPYSPSSFTANMLPQSFCKFGSEGVPAISSSFNHNLSICLWPISAVSRNESLPCRILLLLKNNRSPSRYCILWTELSAAKCTASSASHWILVSLGRPTGRWPRGDLIRAPRLKIISGWSSWFKNITGRL